MRALVGILGCNRHPYKFRREGQRQTWLNDLNFTHKFFLGNGKPTNEDEIILGCLDDYNSLLLKSRGMFEWALKNNYDALFKCDDDTFVIPERLERFSLSGCDYTGQLQNIDCLGKRFCSGGGYWLSRRALQVLVDAPERSRYHYVHGPESGWRLHPEDKWVGLVLHEHGIRPCDGSQYYTSKKFADDETIIAKWEYTPEEMEEEYNK